MDGSLEKGDKSPENKTLKNFVSLGRKMSQVYSEFTPLYEAEDYQVLTGLDMQSMERDEILQYHEEMREIERIKKETPLREIFPVVSKYIETMKELSDLKAHEKLLPQIITKAHEQEDAQGSDGYVQVSNYLDLLQNLIDTQVGTFAEVEEMIEDYEKNYEIKKAAGTLEEAEEKMKKLFVYYKSASKSIFTMMAVTASGL